MCFTKLCEQLYLAPSIISSTLVYIAQLFEINHNGSMGRQLACDVGRLM